MKKLSRKKSITSTPKRGARAVTEAPLADADMVLAVKAYFATVDSLLAAEAVLGVVLRDSIDPVEQSSCSAEILRVRRELELLKNKRRAIMDGTARINPPTDEMVAESQRIAAALAQVISDNKTFAAIVDLVNDALDLYGRIQA